MDFKLKPKCPQCDSSNMHCLESFADYPYKWKCLDCGKISIIRYGVAGIDEAPATESTSDRPPLRQGWICPRCGKVNAPYALQCTCEPKEPIAPAWSSPSIAKPGTWYSSPACESCPTNPKNGGNGHCNCILGTWGQVTCSTAE